MQPVAIIDLGTNTFHLLITELNGSYEVKFRARRSVRLGHEGMEEKQIHPNAQERALSALSYFKGVIKENNINEVHAYGTSAFRNANNGRVFAQKIKENTGIEVNIIDGEREAELICNGVRLATEIEDHTLIVDIGGGSVEFIIANEKDVLWKRSYEIGAQRLLQMFHKEDPIHPDDVDCMETYLSNELEELFIQLRKYQVRQMVGASGTFDTLFDIQHSRNNKKTNKKSTTEVLDKNTYWETHRKLLTLDKEGRLAMKGMIPMRADMIVVASCLISFILKRHLIELIKTSRYALKEGVLYEIINENASVSI